MTTILENARRVQRGEAPPPPVGRLLGFVLKSIEPGRAVFEMEADERHHNPMGTLHGGIIATWPTQRWAKKWIDEGCPGSRR
jgi:acyl-coenzyme A thioesterase PaaI-like protein